MITVILDTNILHQEGLYSRSMQLLGRLAASGELQMSVPELVKKEFISKRVLDSRERLQGAHAAFGDLAKKLGRGDPIYDELTVLEGQVTSLRERIAPALENAFEEWVKINKVLVIKFNPEAITEVFDDYFAGKGAYRRPKCREDIPDAIVSSCIRSLVQAGSGTHVVVRDGVLKKHLLSVDGLTVSDDLTEFFAVAEVRALIERLDAPLKDVEELKAFLAGQLFRKRLSDFLSQATDLLEHVYVEEEAIDGISYLEIDCFGVSVNYAQAKSISAIDYGQVTYIEKGCFAMEIKINTVAAIHYCADYGDYIARSDEVEEVSMNSDGISDLRENRMVILRGYVEVLFDATLTAHALEICTRNLAADSSITIELSIDSASIL